jgi:threonine dehydrogenase-like Zn-dependent dehydrogenase
MKKGIRVLRDSLLSRMCLCFGFAVLVMSVVPGERTSAAIECRPRPEPEEGELLVRGIAIGICGTDRDVVLGRKGRPPERRHRLVLGHESLGRVVTAPANSPYAPGDLVVGMVRRPDPVPCVSCAAGEWDACRNGRYTSCGITERDGYGAQLWCAAPEFIVPVAPGLAARGVLVEPVSVLAKAWERITAMRPREHPRCVLVTGAGPLGLLAALLAAQRGYRTFLYTRTWTTRRSSLADRLGVTALERLDGVEPDVVLETTGAPHVLAGALDLTARNAVVCLLGLTGGEEGEPPALASAMRRLVPYNGVLFGTVNAARRHYTDAVQDLDSADRAWLDDLITRQVPLDRWHEALERRPDDLKVVVTLEGPAEDSPGSGPAQGLAEKTPA